MKVISVVAIFAAAVLAAPAELEQRAYNPCPGGLLFGSPVCCTTNVLQVADLDCKTPPSSPKDAQDFNSICAKGGGKAQCCTVPAAGLGVLCQPIAG